MFPSIAVARVNLFEEVLPKVDQIAQSITIASMTSNRNEALNVWRDLESPGSYLAIASSLEDSPDTHAWSRVEQLAGSEELLSEVFGSVDLHPMLPHRIHGMQARKAEVGHLVSLSLRKADPGMADALLDEMVGIFESLKYLDGYLGCALGANAALPEEMVGIVFWRDLESYESSGPRRGLYEIRAYERIL